MSVNRNPVVVIDFGAQYAELIARRVREAHIFSVLLPYTTSCDEIFALNPQAIVLTGGPADVSEKDAPRIPKGLLDAGVPVFGICYGFQEIANTLNGQTRKARVGEYGLVEMQVNNVGQKNKLFENMPDTEEVWMSHKIEVSNLPEGFKNYASTLDTKIAAFGNEDKKIYGVQWHPEVVHTEYGQQMLENFLKKIANIKENWTADFIIENQVNKIRSQIGDKKAICGLSGGVDSAVAAALVNKAIGKNLKCVFINHGLLREREEKSVEIDFCKSTGANLLVANDSKLFLEKLKGVKDPEQKRKIIGEQFIRSFEKAVSSLDDDFGFLVQGTLYPDIVESGGGAKKEAGASTANIKSHHNVGGLPDDMKFELVEPLKNLFKDEVREIGKALGLPDFIVKRQPFPGPGLAVRIVGEVNGRNLSILRAADEIAREVLEPYYEKIWQCPIVLLADVKTVGVKGDERHFGHPIVLRPVASEDAMTADWFELPKDVLTKVSNRITNEVKEITRVVVDVTQKPPGTIEWE
ncbi:MAG: glutamine-hydrolyzing GMP synthase [Bifidobacteriaceae bacterium]|jgi:GMP synthase (glutamine-hydrolysing)|nr:glutamine-hydrolyzing GMP synthase [Bifidobacteriaceae bacterium]